MGDSQSSSACFSHNEGVQPSISVALCTHNGARFIDQQVASILAQTLLPTEIVLSDDASTDDTVARVRVALAHSAIALTVIENRAALGVTRNFEQAIIATSGDIVALSDQDDRWLPDRLQKLCSAIREHDLLLVHSDARLVDEAGSPLGVTLLDALGVGAAERRQIHAADGLSVLMHRNVVTGATTAFTRRLLQSALPFPSAWVHDEWLAAIAAAVGRFDLVDEPLTDYRQHSSNQIGASELTIATRIARLREPREARNQRLVERASALVERLDALPGLSAHTRSLAAGKLAHESARRALPAPRFARIVPAFREWRTGRYAEFGRGSQDLLRDLVQPAR